LELECYISYSLIKPIRCQNEFSFGLATIVIENEYPLVLQ